MVINSYYSLYMRIIDIDNVEEEYELAINSVSVQRVCYYQLWVDYIRLLIFKINNSKKSVEVCVTLFPPGKSILLLLIILSSLYRH